MLGRLARDPAIDHSAAEAAGVEVVRRSSGGGPVLWDRHLLALDVVLPRGHLLAGDDVVDAYRWLGEAIAVALRRLGMRDVVVVDVPTARASRAAPGIAADACFGGLSPYEVTSGGRKVVGLSQARRQGGALLQAGVPMRFDAEGLAHLMGRNEAFAAGLRAAAAGITETLPGCGADDLIREVDDAVREALGVELEPSDLRDDELAARTEAR